MFVELDGDTELARAADVMMAQAKRIYILIIKVDKLFSLFSSRCFLKEIANMYFVFLSSYRNTGESLGELEKAVEILACGLCSHSISRSPKLPLVFLLNKLTSVFLCVCPVIDHKFLRGHNIVKVAVDPRDDSRVDLRTTLTML